MRPVSVVVPTRRLGQALRERCAWTVACLPGAEIVISEPEDLVPHETEPRLPGGWRLVRAPRGRGTQCNGGARAAAGELLMFLHDDTDLPPDAGPVLEAAFHDPGIGMACFRLAFDRRHWLLDAYAWGSRFESRLTTFGDQAMTIRRSLFDAVGGFPDWPLFEDVE
ncbi:MAG TPA: glycosyltransferase, partial [Lamprocystis sp. (in: g-proteobacteria)]|nr:glycosyltransferase [Lamprocystis sp. (in: g-proteobacteria)]